MKIDTDLHFPCSEEVVVFMVRIDKSDGESFISSLAKQNFNNLLCKLENNTNFVDITLKVSLSSGVAHHFRRKEQLDNRAVLCCFVQRAKRHRCCVWWCVAGALQL